MHSKASKEIKMIKEVWEKSKKIKFLEDTIEACQIPYYKYIKVNKLLEEIKTNHGHHNPKFLF